MHAGVPVEAAEEEGMQLARTPDVLRTGQDVIELVGILARDVAERDGGEARGDFRGESHVARRTSLRIEHQHVHQDDVTDEQRDRRRDLHANHPVAVGQLEQSRRHDVEIGRHGRGERAAEPGEHTDGAHDGRIAAEPVHDERHADGRGHDRERGECIAHHHRKERHAEAIGDHGRQRMAERQPGGRDVADRRSDARDREYRAERGQQLRQNDRPADGISRGAGPPPPAPAPAAGTAAAPRRAR